MTRGAPALALALAAVAAAPARSPAAGKAPRAGLVRISYDAPKDAAHAPVAARLREQKVLETIAEVLGAVRLPRPLTLRFAGCGEANAWYEPEDRTVTFCYELAAELEAGADGGARYGIAREDAASGPVVFVLLHECGHALFDLLEVPILGREEDAADQVAAYALLRAGPAVARRALAGTAWMYKRDASLRSPEERDLADVHALDAQRLYNVLCMAYGSDPAAYRGMVEKGYLPEDRAEGCHEEYEQVGFAVRRLIGKSLDPRAVERTRALHAPRWNAPPPAPTR